MGAVGRTSKSTRDGAQFTLFDSHAHPHFRAFQGETTEVIQHAMDDGVGMLLVGTQQATSRLAVETAARFPHTWAAIGLHPIHTTPGYFDPNEEDDSKMPRSGFQRRAEVFDAEFYQALAASSSRVVAIGEVGLDYYRLSGDEKTQAAVKETQQRVFRAQVVLSTTLDLPLSIHCRDAHDDVYAILREAAAQSPNVRGVIHCFTGTPAEAERYLALGFFISFSGIITFAHDWDAFIKATPLERLLIETDCPYLTPVPHRGQRNEPRYVRYTAAHLAELVGASFAEVAAVTSANARRLFKLDGSMTA